MDFDAQVQAELDKRVEAEVTRRLLAARLDAAVEARLEAEVTRRLEAVGVGVGDDAAAPTAKEKEGRRSPEPTEAPQDAFAAGPDAATDAAARAAFEDRLTRKKGERTKKSARRLASAVGGAAKASGRALAVVGARRCSVDEERQHRQREQEEKDNKLKQDIRRQREATEEQRGSGGKANAEDAFEERRRRQREQEEKDNKLKQNIRRQREAAKEQRGGGGKASVEDAFEERRRRQREQDEKDNKLKQDIRRQREAAKEQRGGGGKASVEDAFEERRRRQREQEEKDNKLKQDIRRQRETAKEQRGGGGKASAEDTFEDRRRRQREQEEKDSKLKQDIRRQREAAKEQRGGGGGAKASAEGGFEERRRRHHEQEEKDNKLKQDIRRQREAAKEQRDGGGKASADDALEERRRRQREQEEKDSKQKQDIRRKEVDAKNAMIEQSTKNDIDAWQVNHSLNKALSLALITPEMEWLSSLYRCDPRWQIMKFFDEVAREGGEAPMDENLAASPLACLFNKATVFTVWRPTSDEAIKNMMLGDATGKGLDIKGKSAKKGNISSYVPFIQIYEEAHKEEAEAFLIDGTVRVFYQSEEDREDAHEMLLDIQAFMAYAVQDAMKVLSDEFATEKEQKLAMKMLAFDENNTNVAMVDTYVDSSPPVFGLDMTERMFWKAYVTSQDCSRPPGTEWDTGRGSEPNFMKFNWNPIRAVPEPGDPKAVVYQKSKGSPMEPRTLLMAYEEFGKVKPVVSDFDCFLLGSRGVKYKEPIPKDQMKLVKWTVKNVGEVLDERAQSNSTEGWMHTWMKVQKKSALKGYYPSAPKYGYGDPKSYEITSVAVPRLQSTGCVRHGPECFNWYFPQEIDEEFLVVSDTLPGNLKWKKMNVEELQEILIEKIDQGFTFPINPKWVLCDPGWRRVYDKLLASTKPNVQDSINCWMPPETGLRKKIDSISARHPLGFRVGSTSERSRGNGLDEMVLMEEELERYIKIAKLWRKVRFMTYWIGFFLEKKRDIRKR